MSNFKLCYVSDGVAWFTTQPLHEQWGDDWNDAPYEHNAGTPYSGDGWDLQAVHYRCDALWTPGEIADGNSSYSVQGINRQWTPWLAPGMRCDQGRVSSIFAGCSVAQFEQRIWEAGGTIFVAKPNPGFKVKI